MRRSAVALLLVLLLSVSACTAPQKTINGSGTVVTRTLTFPDVTGVILSAPGEMDIVLGDQVSLLVEMEDNLIPYLETPLQEGRLAIRFTEGINAQPTKPIHYTLTVVGLNAIASSSTGDILVPKMVSDTFSIKLSSTGNLVMDGLVAENIDVELSSLGNLTINGGEVVEQTATLNSNGSYQAGNLLSQTAVVTISSSGNATLWVVTRLDASISSSGNVSYYGSPETNINSSSSGKGIPLGDK